MSESIDFAAICRTCLRTDKLNPIFLNPEKSMQYSMSIFMVAGLKVEMNDGLPQNMCVLCINNLNNAINFRKQCKDAESRLLQIKSEITTTALENTDSVNVKNEITSENEFDSSITVKKEQLTKYVHVKHEEFKQVHIKDETVKYVEMCIEKDDDDEPLMQLVERKDSSLSNEDAVKSKRKLKRDKKHKTLCQSTDEKDKIERVYCKICLKELSIRSIHKHIEICHPGLNAGKVKCEMCDSRLTAAKMNRHVQLMHASGNLRCRYCQTLFEDKQHLVEHVATCTAKKRKAYSRGRELAECDVCHKVMQRASLRLHTAVKHKGLGPVCEHCGRKFGNSLRLNEHYRAKHGYEKLKCGRCDYQTASEAALQNHSRRHRGEKPFVCDACGARFHAAYLLAQHKHSHRTERPFRCVQCHASFKSNNGLLMHKHSCHSTRTYVCLLCSRTFRWRHYAVRHIRQVHQFKGKNPPLGEVKPGEVPSLAAAEMPSVLPNLASPEARSAEPSLATAETPSKLPSLATAEAPSTLPSLATSETPNTLPSLATADTLSASPSLTVVKMGTDSDIVT